MSNVLAIETSCDETAVALLEFTDEQKFNIKFEIVASQISEHSKYGGVVPEIASRMHIETISKLIDHCILESGIDKHKIDAITVTNSPGLVGALLVGINYAKSFAYSLKKPLVAVNHLEGHVSALYINNRIEFPFLCLVVSGGHTLILRVDSFREYKILATTVDDAAGEAFDKIARVLNLGYPGGPKIEKIAKLGNPEKYHFPRVKIEGSDNFSFSGIKTAVINTVHKHKQLNQEFLIKDVAASFQSAVCEALCSRLIKVSRQEQIQRIAIAGGVACNDYLRELLVRTSKTNGVELFIPLKQYCNDNAVMIGIRGYHEYKALNFSGMSINAVPRSVL